MEGDVIVMQDVFVFEQTGVIDGKKGMSLNQALRGFQESRGLDPTLKSARLANYLVSLRKDLLHLAHACGRGCAGWRRLGGNRAAARLSCSLPRACSRS